MVRRGEIACLPRLVRAGQMEIRHRETSHTGLGLRSTTGGALVPDLPTGTRGRPRKGEIAVGWLWVSTFIRTCATPSRAAYGLVRTARPATSASAPRPP